MEVVYASRKGELYIFEIRLKSSRTFEWNEVKGVKLGLQDDTDGNVREDLILLIKDEWIGKMFDCECVNTRFRSANFKCKR